MVGCRRAEFQVRCPESATRLSVFSWLPSILFPERRRLSAGQAGAVPARLPVVRTVCKPSYQKKPKAGRLFDNLPTMTHISDTIPPSARTAMLTYLTRSVMNFLKQEDGPTSVEYAINLALIGTVIVSSVGGVSNKATKAFNTVSNTLSTGS
jgi:pilus assembly protein Flp/PilA